VELEDKLEMTVEMSGRGTGQTVLRACPNKEARSLSRLNSQLVGLSSIHLQAEYSINRLPLFSFMSSLLPIRGDILVYSGIHEFPTILSSNQLFLRIWPLNIGLKSKLAWLCQTVNQDREPATFRRANTCISGHHLTVHYITELTLLARGRLLAFLLVSATLTAGQEYPALAI
jgi:hypothetical protein